MCKPGSILCVGGRCAVVFAVAVLAVEACAASKFGVKFSVKFGVGFVTQ